MIKRSSSGGMGRRGRRKRKRRKKKSRSRCSSIGSSSRSGSSSSTSTRSKSRGGDSVRVRVRVHVMPDHSFTDDLHLRLHQLFYLVILNLPCCFLVACNLGTSVGIVLPGGFRG